MVQNGPDQVSFLLFFGISPVDFALKVVQWSESETVRLQLWDIAGILKGLLKFSMFWPFLPSFFPSSSPSFPPSSSFFFLFLPLQK